MAAAGGRVLALRSVEFARNHRVPLHVRSSFTWEPGTWVTEEDPSMEEPIISGVTHDVAEAKVTVRNVPDRPGIAARLFRALADANVNVDMIVQNTSVDGSTDISFTVPKADMGVAEKIVADVAEEIGAGGVTHDETIAKVSVVGSGMRTSPGIAAKVFETMATNGVNIEMISTSTIRITCVVARPTWSGPSSRSTRRSVSTRARATPAPSPSESRSPSRAASRDAGNSRSGRAVPEPMPGATEVSMTVVALVRAGGWVDRNEVALARAYGATKAVYAVCRMVQDGEAVDPVTARAFRRRAERTGAGLLSLGGEGSSVGTQTVHALLGTWAGGLARAGSYLEAYLLAGVAPEAPADVFDSLLHVGMMFEADLGGHPACESAVSAAFASAVHPAAS